MLRGCNFRWNPWKVRRLSGIWFCYMYSFAVLTTEPCNIPFFIISFPVYMFSLLSFSTLERHFCWFNLRTECYPGFFVCVPALLVETNRKKYAETLANCMTDFVVYCIWIYNICMKAFEWERTSSHVQQ